jgi:hypothetical protein
MKYIDYSWDLEPNRILFDEELDIDRLGWKNGDCFKVANIDGRAMLVKLDPVEQFVKGHSVNVQEK